jgi:hypothetical protein
MSVAKCGARAKELSRISLRSSGLPLPGLANITLMEYIAA